jgi:cytoskeletal protein CcmA (bactofilin family)
MWRDKKPDRPLVSNPEAKDLLANQPSKPSHVPSEGTTQISKEAVRPMGATAGTVAAHLGPSLHVKGEISDSEDLYIDGMVEGLVQFDERKLTVGTTAKVMADIIAGEVVVCGNVKGNVRAKNRIEIKKEGSVTGYLTTPQILIEDGAYFKGSIEIDRVAEKEADKNVLSQMTSTPPAATAAGAGSKSM